MAPGSSLTVYSNNSDITLQIGGSVRIGDNPTQTQSKFSDRADEESIAGSRQAPDHRGNHMPDSARKPPNENIPQEMGWD